MSLIAQLKSRNVFRVTAAYALVAWLVAQLAEFATGTFGAPGWVLRTFVVLLVLGLPVAIILAWAFDLTPTGVRKTSADDTPTPRSRGTNYAVITLLGVVLIAAVVLQFWGPEISASRPTAAIGPSSEMQSLKFDIALPEDTPLAFVGAATLGNGRRAFAISPDGTQLAFAGIRDGEYALYLRDLDTLAARKLDGTENGYDPFFSPNGQWIAFFAGNELKRVAADGGAAVTITEATNSAGGTWLGNDGILAFTDEGGDLLQVSFRGEREESVLPGSGAAPHALPDGSHVLWSTGRDGQIVVFDSTSKELQPLSIRGNDPRYLREFLFYTQGNTLFAVRFDPKALALQSTPVPVLTGVRVEIYGFSQWTLAENGTLLYAPGIAAAENPLIWVDENGREDLRLPQRQKGTFEISPDGKHLAVLEHQSGSRDIWLYDFEGTVPRKLSFDSDISGNQLTWLPGGEDIIFSHRTDTGRVPYRLSLEAGHSGTPLLDGDEDGITVYSVSADGRYLGITRTLRQPVVDENTNREYIAVIDRVENTEVEIPMVGSGNWGTAVSPNGHAVVYTSPASGEYQNYLQPIPPTGVRYQVSRVGGAEEPRWSRDGKKIYFRSGKRIMVVDVQLSPEIMLSEPRVFYKGEFVNVGGRSYDISADGKRALVILASEDTSRSIRLVTHWLDEVERIVSASESP